MRRVLAELWNFLGFPHRAFLFPERWQRSIGLKPVRSERHQRVARLARGTVLDVACGDNLLATQWLRPSGRRCVGLDTLRGGADVVADAAELPFRDGCFGTVTIVAALNHIARPERERALREVTRVLEPGGLLVVTMIGPAVGRLCHLLTWWDPWPVHDKTREDPGLPCTQVMRLAESAGFKLVRRDRFLYGLNAAFLFQRS